VCGVCTRVRILWQGAGLRSRRGVVAVFAAEPGSKPGVAASAASAIGSRGCVWVHDGQQGALTAAKDEVPPSLPYSIQSMDSRPRRGHGGVTAASGGVGTKKGLKARPRLQGYGARVLGCTPASVRRGPHRRVRGHARDANAARARRHSAAVTKRGGVLRLEG
jgi:hypothetical protein